MAPFFFYGTLRDPELLVIVLGRGLAGLALCRAEAPGTRVVTLEDEAYPVLAEAPGRAAEGVLVGGLGAADLARLEYFEEAEYGLSPIRVRTADGEVEAQVFRGTAKARPSGADWDYGRWRRKEQRVACHAARELMGFFGTLPSERIDDVWTGIMNRARARARAETAPMPGGGPRSGFGPEDVEAIARARAWAGYFSVEEHRLRHRAHGGGWVGPVSRAVALSGDAVTVLPYDARRDAVLLVEQFRAAAFARGDANPWCIEPVAGRIDGPEGPEEVARREAGEEAGVTLGRIERIAEVYSTPGITSEAIVAYCGEADLAGAGGIHGLDGENEDIRAIVMDFDAAMAAVAAGQVNTAPAVLSLLWLARERERLRAAWG